VSLYNAFYCQAREEFSPNQLPAQDVLTKLLSSFFIFYHDPFSIAKPPSPFIAIDTILAALCSLGNLYAALRVNDPKSPVGVA
jgi:hypothetical protein